MKAILLNSLLFFFLSISAIAQPPVPNGNFESWTSGQPDGWVTNYEINPTLISQTTGVTGSAVMGTVVLYEEFMFALSPSISTNYEGMESFPIDGDYPGVSFQYKFNPTNGDNIFISVVTYDANDNETAAGFLNLEDPAASFTQGYVSLINFAPGATKMSIGAVISNFNTGIPNVGSSYVLDNFAIVSEPLNIAEPNATGLFNINRVYPNPANEQLMIDLESSVAGAVEVELFDLAGRKTMSESYRIASGKSSLTIPVLEQATGMYLLRLRSGEFVQTERVRIAH